MSDIPTPVPPSPEPPATTPAPQAQPTPQPHKTIYINYFDGINESKVKALMAICSDIVASQRPDTLYFLFSSNGGSVNAGIALYNFLRALPVEIVMHNTGSIDSIATVIFLAANKRYAALHSTFLFHGVQLNFPQGAVLNHTQLQERVSMIKQDENKIAGIIAARTTLSEGEIRQLFHQGEAKDLTFAIEKGIIHEAKDAAIPKDAPFMTVNLN
jgi:ATP-dependent Clp protease, protease subunit